MDDLDRAETRRSRRRRRTRARGRRRCSRSRRTRPARGSSATSTAASGRNCTSPHLVTFTDPEELEGDRTPSRCAPSTRSTRWRSTPRRRRSPGTSACRRTRRSRWPRRSSPIRPIRRSPCASASPGTDDFTNPIDIEFECRLDSDAVRHVRSAAGVRPDDADARPAHVRRARRRLAAAASTRPRTGHNFTVEPTPDTTILTGPDPVGDGVTATSATFTFYSDIAGGDVRVPPRPRSRRLRAVRVRRHLHRARPRRAPVRGAGQDGQRQRRPGAGRVRAGSSATTRRRRRRSSPGRRRHRRRRPTRR